MRAQGNGEPPRLLVVTNNRHRVFQRSIIAGAREVARGRSCPVEVAEVPEPSDAAGLVGRLAGENLLVMLVANVLPDDLVAELHGGGTPVTLVSHRVAGLEVPSIMHDNRHGFELLAAEVLDRCGRTRPVYVGGSGRQRDSVERESAFRRQLMRRGLAIDRRRFLSGEFEPGRAAAELGAFLDAGGELDSLVAADYLMAISCLEELRKRGLDAPDEVAVAGFGDGPEAKAAGITTVAADVVELGRRAARQLLGQADGLEILGLTLLSTTLIRRASTA